MKTLSIAGVVLASLSVSRGQSLSWEDSEAADLYIRDLDEYEFDIRDLNDDLETDLFARDLLENEEEQPLQIRNNDMKNIAIYMDILNTTQEMAAAVKEMGPKVDEAGNKLKSEISKGYDATKWKASIAKASQKAAKSKSKSGKKKTQDEKDDDLMDKEDFWTKRDATSDATAIAKFESTVQCATLFNSFDPKSQLSVQLMLAARHLILDQWQYMEWEMLTLQAVQMSKILGSCNAAGIADPKGRLGNIWMSFSSVVSGLAAGARKNTNFPDKKMQQLARDFAGYQSY